MNDAENRPGRAIRELVLLEQLVIEELKGKKAETPEKGPDGKFKAATPEPKPTATPKPPTEVSARSALPPDESQAAVKREDFRAFKAAEDRKALQRRRGM